MLEERVKELNVIPSVQEKVIEALEAEGIVEDNKLDAILPALKSALEITKASDGTFNVALVDKTTRKILRHDDDTLWSVHDFIRDYVFEPLAAGVTGIPYADTQRHRGLKDQDLKDIASGKKVILPPKKGRAARSTIASTDRKGMSKNIEDIASGKTEVDMSR